MKKHLLMLFLVYIAITAYGQKSIPNGNFEQWNSQTCDNPQNYPFTSNIQNFFRFNLAPNVTKTTDVKHGSYAVQLTTLKSGKDTSAGYFLNFNPNNSNGGPSTWSGGVPYNQKPKGIRGWYKYNLATTDSATILVTFSKAGANIGSYMYTIGGVQTTYKLFNFTFTPALSQTPDSVIFGAVSCKLTGTQQQPTGIPGEILKIDSVSFTGVSSQPALMNGDFESWQSQTLNSPADWNIQSDMGEGFNQTTDAEKGSYAIELKTYLGNNNNQPAAQPGQISTGYYPCNNCNEIGGYPFSNQKDTLAFYYKFAPAHLNDSAWINLNFKKNSNIIFSEYIYLFASTNYQYEEIPFDTYSIPDTVIINIQSSMWNDIALSYVGADLKIDEIHFKSQPLNTGIINYESDNTISIFPNPTNGMIHIQGLGTKVQSLEIYNILAEKVYATSNVRQQTLKEIDLSQYQKGIYFVKIYDGVKIHTEKIVIQ